MYYETLREEARPDAPLEDRLALFLAGDDAEAKATVGSLIEGIGFAPVDVGSLADGRGAGRTARGTFRLRRSVPGSVPVTIHSQVVSMDFTARKR